MLKYVSRPSAENMYKKKIQERQPSYVDVFYKLQKMTKNVGNFNTKSIVRIHIYIRIQTSF